MSYQKVTGPLMANSHPGSYCGQDAYSDMFVTEYVRNGERHANELGWHTDSSDSHGKQLWGGSENA